MVVRWASRAYDGWMYATYTKEFVMRDIKSSMQSSMTERVNICIVMMDIGWMLFE